MRGVLITWFDGGLTSLHALELLMLFALDVSAEDFVLRRPGYGLDQHRQRVRFDQLARAEMNGRVLQLQLSRVEISFGLVETKSLAEARCLRMSFACGWRSVDGDARSGALANPSK